MKGGVKSGGSGKDPKSPGRRARDTIIVLLSAAAILAVSSMVFFPVIKVTGTNMEPTLQDGDVLITFRQGSFNRGDIAAFYYNTKILLKRVIALEGDEVTVREDGAVFVNGSQLEEPYISEPSLGENDLTYPYTVPEGKIFTLGDHRATSIDSRSNAIGSVSSEFIVGNVVFRIWPLDKIGPVS